MKFLWDEAKNTLLKEQRGISFEKVVEAYANGNRHIIMKHENQTKYPDQFVLVIEINAYFCRVPFVWHDKETVFLKTIYPSRKETKKWMIK